MSGLEPLESPRREAPAGTLRRANTPPPKPKADSSASYAGGLLPGQAEHRERGLKRTVSASPDRDKKAFIRKVYSILSAQVAFTIVVSGSITLTDSLRNAFLGFIYMCGLGFFVGLLISTFVVLFALYAYKNDAPTNYYLLTGFTFLMSLNMSVTLCVIHEELHKEGDDAIIHAGFITLAMFLGLTLYTFQSDTNFSFMGAYLHMSLWSMLVAGVIFALFDIHQFDVIAAWLGALMFCGYIIYDTWKVSNVYGVDDYIPATIELYLDIINLFMYILEIVAPKAKKK